MKIISQPVDSVSKSWGVQKPGAFTYRPIRFLLTKQVEDGLLLQNTVTGELVLLNNDEIAVFNSLPASYNDSMKELVEKHFLVPLDYNEEDAVNGIRKILQLFSKSKNITGYTILPTTCCNARCFYCYEANIEKFTMSEQTANDLVKFISENCGSNKKVSLSWFGGEPTLGVNRINQICNSLKELGIEYKSSMISNAFLFDEEMAALAKDLWKLTNIQITLDGTEEVYNKVKSYVGVKESAYKRVIRNIGLLLKKEITVSVRMNLDRYNYEDLKLLITELSEKFSGNKYFSAYVSPLFDDCGFTPVKHDESDAHWLLQKKNELDALILKNDICFEVKQYLPSLKISHCMASGDNSVIVTPNGDFSKCEHHITDDIVGSIYTGITKLSRLSEWKVIARYDECTDCPLLPTCSMPKECASAKACYEEMRSSNFTGYYAAIDGLYNKQKQ